MPRRSRFAYQPALDGVRAVAVAMVSVFFTLSGYLITSLALVEHHYSDRAATEIADDFLAPLLLDAVVS